MFESLNGMSTGFRTMEYNWRDVALYALAIGAEEDDLPFTYEKDMKVIPTFGVLPVFSNINILPEQPSAYSAFFLARDLMARELGRQVPNGLHMWHEITIERPMDPISGKMIYEQRIQGSYPWKGKGVITELEIPVYDEAGRLLCMNRSTAATRISGLIEDDTKPPVTKVSFPDREPDLTSDSLITRTQNMLYRLTGDTTPAHADPEVAREQFQSEVFMHGLCTYGFACRMAIKAVLGFSSEKVTRFAAQMRAMVFPGTPIRILIWKTSDTSAVFKLINPETGTVLLDHGALEWKQ